MTHRFLLASDIHYTTDLLPSQLKQQFPDAIGSAASGEGLVNVYRGTGRVLLAPVAK